jgi:hypothetical protein
MLEQGDLICVFRQVLYLQVQGHLQMYLLQQRLFTSNMEFSSYTVRLNFSIPIKGASSQSDIATITEDLEDDSNISGYYNRFTNRHHTKVRRYSPTLKTR